MLDVRFFANPRFSAASVAVTLVFFAMFGALFFVSPVPAVRARLHRAASPASALLPLAASLMIAAPLSRQARRPRSAPSSWSPPGWPSSPPSLVVLSFAERRLAATGSSPLTLVLVGVGMGLAMAPATDSIMGSLPPERAGVGSAVNDTTREIGGALGVAILGSITSASYAASITGHRRLHHGRPGLPGGGRGDGGLHRRGGRHRGAGAGAVRRRITAAANAAFIDALGPDDDRRGRRRPRGRGRGARSGSRLVRDVPDLDLELGGDEAGRVELVVDAARSMPSLSGAGRATLQLLAEAGMSSLSFAAISARSGVPTATLERHWTSKVDAVEDAARRAVRAAADPRHRRPPGDLDRYLAAQGELLSHPGARAVIGTLIKESAADPDLGAELRSPAGPAAPGSARRRGSRPAGVPVTSHRTRTWSRPPSSSKAACSTERWSGGRATPSTRSSRSSAPVAPDHGQPAYPRSPGMGRTRMPLAVRNCRIWAACSTTCSGRLPTSTP